MKKPFHPWMTIDMVLLSLALFFTFYCISRRDPRLPMALVCLAGAGFVYWKETQKTKEAENESETRKGKAKQGSARKKRKRKS